MKVFGWIMSCVIGALVGEDLYSAGIDWWTSVTLGITTLWVFLKINTGQEE